jgi:hypothetical protein
MLQRLRSGRLSAFVLFCAKQQLDYSGKVSVSSPCGRLPLLHRMIGRNIEVFLYVCVSYK